MVVFLEFYFYVIVLFNGVPISVAQHSFADKKMCDHIYSVVVSEAKKGDVLSAKKSNGLITEIVPEGCVKREVKED